MTKKQFLLNVIAFVLAWLLLPFLLLFSDACPKGWVDYEGTCAALLLPKESVLAPLIVVGSETPPKDKMPSYQREEIKADMPPSCASTNNCSDQQAIDATAEGKRKAGIK